MVGCYCLDRRWRVYHLPTVGSTLVPTTGSTPERGGSRNIVSLRSTARQKIRRPTDRCPILRWGGSHRTKPSDEDGFVTRFSWHLPMTTANRKSTRLTLCPGTNLTLISLSPVSASCRCPDLNWPQPAFRDTESPPRTSQAQNRSSPNRWLPRSHPVTDLACRSKP